MVSRWEQVVLPLCQSAVSELRRPQGRTRHDRSPVSRPRAVDALCPRRGQPVGRDGQGPVRAGWAKRRADAPHRGKCQLLVPEEVGRPVPGGGCSGHARCVRIGAGAG